MANRGESESEKYFRRQNEEYDHDQRGCLYTVGCLGLLILVFFALFAFGGGFE